jgi:hypothetical protein
MKLNQYLELQQYKNLITLDDLSDISDRTLLYGYNLLRDVCHLYLKDKTFHYREDSLVANRSKTMSSFDLEFIPVEIIDPAKSDFEFCKLLKLRGFELYFDKFEDVPESTFYGRLISE